MWYNRSINKHAVYVIIFAVVLITVPVGVFAASSRPIGARITQANLIAGKQNKILYDTVVCAARDWMMLTPIGNTGAGPGVYYVSFGNRKGPMAASDATKNKYLKGMINPQVDTNTCYVPGSPAPVPSHEIMLYGF